jgi:exosome complex exonuclease DIS3/RRP44
VLSLAKSAATVSSAGVARVPQCTVEVGVHIADVTYFVKQGTPIDVEAAARGNTTYLVERRLDMLPGLLTETLCSLKGGLDRFAFSAQWRFERLASDAPASELGVLTQLPPSDRWRMVPGSTTFAKTIIHSRAAMTYAAAQALVDAPTGSEAASTSVAQSVKLLASIARSLRARRQEAGALSLASAEVRFALDSETADPIDVAPYEARETNSTVEEFMLLGNCAVAEKITQAYPRHALLRRHPAPPQTQFASLLAAAASVGVTLKTGSSKELADSLDEAAASPSSTPARNKLLRILATRCMMQATYFPSGTVQEKEFVHYGLAAPIYTHFTSPIRRYADVIAHRLLAAALAVEPLPAAYEDGAHMKSLADNCNRRHLASALAGRASGALHTNRFFKGRVMTETALVMRLRSNGVVVLVPRFGLESVVVLGRGQDSPEWTGSGPAPRTLSFDEAKQTLVDASEPSLRLTVFQEVTVALAVVVAGRGRKTLAVRIIKPAFMTAFAPEELPGGEEGVGGTKRPAPAAASPAKPAGGGVVKKARAA